MYQFGDTKYLITFDPEEMRAWSVSMKVLENTHLANAPLRIAKKTKKYTSIFLRRPNWYMYRLLVRHDGGEIRENVQR